VELERLRRTVNELQSEVGQLTEANAALLAKEEQREGAPAAAAPVQLAAEYSASVSQPFRTQ
jgi:hypothetical protein